MMPVCIKERAKSLKTNLRKNTYKGDNRYLSFYESLCRFNQNETNRIIESAFWRADNYTLFLQATLL